MYDNIKACLTDRIRRKTEVDVMKQKPLLKLMLLVSIMKESDKECMMAL